uniref:Uncharacterized protein n=1 Tax=Spongospora subterranea TaxID=70186 RepID=A0A0H5QJY6_9EUKA|eukprot:CRZ01646.1 hypothetical protein [Spongospora subterranea]
MLSYQDVEAMKTLFGVDREGDQGQLTEHSSPSEFEAVAKTGEELRHESGQIWSPDEVSTDPLASQDSYDGRPEPSYDIKLLQNLSAEDTYFGLSGKDLSSRRYRTC